MAREGRRARSRRGFGGQPGVATRQGSAPCAAGTSSGAGVSPPRRRAARSTRTLRHRQVGPTRGARQQMPATSKQTSCSGVRREDPPQPPKRPLWVLLPRRLGRSIRNIEPASGSPSCTRPPNGASPRRRGSAAPGMSPGGPQTGRPTLFPPRHEATTVRRPSKPAVPAVTRRGQQAPEGHAREDVRRLGALQLAMPDVAAGRCELAAPMPHAVSSSARSLPGAEGASSVTTAHVPPHPFQHARLASASDSARDRSPEPHRSPR